MSLSICQYEAGNFFCIPTKNWHIDFGSGAREHCHFFWTSLLLLLVTNWQRPFSRQEKLLIVLTGNKSVYDTRKREREKENER